SERASVARALGRLQSSQCAEPWPAPFAGALSAEPTCLGVYATADAWRRRASGALHGMIQPRAASSTMLPGGLHASIALSTSSVRRVPKPAFASVNWRMLRSPKLTPVTPGCDTGKDIER